MKRLSTSHRLLSTSTCAVTLAALAACQPRPAADGADGATGSNGENWMEESEGEGEDEKPGAGTPDLAALGSNPFAMLAKLDAPGRYDPPRASADFDASAPHVRVVEIKKPLGELESFSFSLLGGSAATQPERGLYDALDDLAGDEKVTGLVIRLHTGIGIAGADRLREAIVEFKGEGARTVTCHAESLSNGSYHALTACDELVLAPVGSVTISGPAVANVYLKRLLGKLGVEAQMLHIGAYKGAAEPLTRSEPSPEARETMQAILDQGYATMLEGLEQGRGLDHEAAVAAIDQALFEASAAEAAGLVDRIEPYEATLARVAGDGGWKQLKTGSDPMSDPAALPRLLGLVPPERPEGDHVALVYAVGGVVDGRGQGILGAREQIASGTLVPALHALAGDDDVKAVVLRVSSPGGSALASEQIWQATKVLADKKPLVVSMGDVAASGGYYIAAAGERIFAEPNTLTGSIGVVGGKIVYDDALDEIGVDIHGMSKGKRGLMWTSVEPWDEEDQAAVRDYMQATYDVFVGRVADGRGMTRDAVHEVAQGRVWTGVAAKERGLVDELGGLDAALAYAHEKAGVAPDVGLEVYPPEPTLKDMLAGLGSVGLGPTGAALPAEAIFAVRALERVDPVLAAQMARTLGLVFALGEQRVWALDLTAIAY